MGNNQSKQKPDYIVKVTPVSDISGDEEPPEKRLGDRALSVSESLLNDAYTGANCYAFALGFGKKEVSTKQGTAYIIKSQNPCHLEIGEPSGDKWNWHFDQVNRDYQPNEQNIDKYKTELISRVLKDGRTLGISITKVENIPTNIDTQSQWVIALWLNTDFSKPGTWHWTRSFNGGKTWYSKDGQSIPEYLGNRKKIEKYPKRVGYFIVKK